MTAKSCTNDDPAVAKTRSKRRWAWLLGVAVLSMVLLWIGDFHYMFWDGMVQRNIRVRVTDNSTNYPVRGATVTLMQARDYIVIEHLDQTAAAEMLRQSHHIATTNERGEATISGQFGAGGGIGLLGRSGAFGIEGILTISHPKYRTTESMLQNYFQRSEFPLRTKNLELRIIIAPE